MAKKERDPNKPFRSDKGKPRKNKPDKLFSEKQIEEYAKRHALTPTAPWHNTIRPWKWKGAESCNTKLHTPEIKLEAFKQYCEHLSWGRNKQSWSFEHPSITLTWETMEAYIALDKTGVFNKEILKDAQTRGYRYWEQFVEDCAKMATPHDTNAVAMVMRNKYKWDRPDHATSETKAQVHVLLEQMKAAPARDIIDIPNPEIIVQKTAPSGEGDVILSDATLEALNEVE